MGLSALRNTGQLRRAVLLWAIRLVLYPAKVRVPVQRSHFLKRESCILPLPAIATTALTPRLACQAGARCDLLGA